MKPISKTLRKLPNGFYLVYYHLSSKIKKDKIVYIIELGNEKICIHAMYRVLNLIVTTFQNKDLSINGIPKTHFDKSHWGETFELTEKEFLLATLPNII